MANSTALAAHLQPLAVSKRITSPDDMISYRQ